MPKRKEAPLTPEEQSARFRAEVERRIEAGDLNPTDADAAFDDAMSPAGIIRYHPMDSKVG